MSFLYALLSVLLVSLISLVGLFALSIKADTLRKYMFFLVSLAVGALLGSAFLHLIPESLEALNGTTGPLLILIGFLLFFALEKFLRWRHFHGEDSPEGDELMETAAQELAVPGNAGTPSVKPLGYLVLISDGLHNLIDGVIIGASFLVSPEIGVAATVAIILHEIPQEISDFALLLHAGFSKSRALLLNLLSALVAVLGVGIAFALHDISALFVPVATALAAGAFLYIAGSDLVPELHKEVRGKRAPAQFAAILIGISLMLLITHSTEAGHDHGPDAAAHYETHHEEIPDVH